MIHEQKKAEVPYIIERRERTVLVVRMKSRAFRGCVLPDAKFTFRQGDPQFETWESRYFEQQEVCER